MTDFDPTEGRSLRFDLTDLRLFLAVVEHGSLTRGAQALHLSLAAVSDRISGMESALGAALLVRTRRGVHSTAAGAALTHHARRILEQVEHMRGDLRRYGVGLKGRIPLLSNTAALAGVLPQVIKRFLQTYPDLSIDLQERPSHDIVVAIAEGRAELGMVANTTDMAALQTRHILHDQLVVLASTTHPLRDQASVNFADILHEPFVGMAETALDVHLGEHAARLGHPIHYRVALRDLHDVALMAQAGIGIAIVSDTAARTLEAHALTRVPLDETWARRELHLCARDFAALTPQAELLAHMLMQKT